MDGADALLPPLHPGAALRDDLPILSGSSAASIADRARAPRSGHPLERVAAGQIGISTGTALRLGRHLGTSAEFWLGLQHRSELETLSTAIG
ncbi:MULTISPECIES: helix-turn-helix transcriptional regulator [Methylobacterium]|uniref:helix-turn-helix transcriptional regulator n=1 Tax=Methylobacterium TaxID=407 RepID=UPI0008A775E2|nr:hypothetical protein [Methylobacterium sp. 275MFSha3.1]SEH32653.1 addiction module antidote protein, HigA family [Methylobacterium sp. 275MFSha3.1]